MLRAHGLTKNFGELRALDDLHLEVGAGEVLALLGPNGAGKSTATRILVGLTRADAGRLEVDGRSWEASEGDGGAGFRSAEVGYLPEERGLYGDQPVQKSLAYLGVLRGLPKAEAEARARAWLERVDLGERADEKVSALSKGNQQRVQLGAALLHRPRIAFLDEPFSGLDPLWQERLLELIQETARAGTAVILSAHQMHLVERVADRVSVLARGRTVLAGSLDDLRREHDRARVRLRFAASPEWQPDSFGERAVRALDACTLEVEAPADQGLGEVLARALELGELIDVERETLGLHQLYVESVGLAQADADRQVLP
ncbi:MAG: ABC transporter ATP-binding protein [Planctomycetota bacterium]|jgi:ABC-2 type transport system ATP-binding protein